MAEWQGFYSTAQVSRLARIPLRTLYDWRERDIIQPAVIVQNKDGQVEDVGFSYAQLTILKILRALRENQIDLKSMSTALEHLFDRLGPPNQGWANAHVYIVGNRILADKPDEWQITAATQMGQKLEERFFGDLFEELRTLDEPGAILIPQDFRPYVQIDPAVMGGQPVLRDTRIPTSVIAALKTKGKSPTQIAKLYHLSRKLIAKALDYEAFLSRPVSETGTAAAGR
ncbi:MAG TPA: DUF433 domain-containing protein [Dehalococcoidia bacterium]|jgi:uncharacterized protein (DUF433 family)